MKTMPLTLLILAMSCGIVLAQNSATENTVPVKVQSLPTLYFNQDTTALVGNASILTDVGYNYQKNNQILTPVKSIDVSELSQNGYSTFSLQDYLQTHFPLYNGKELIVIDGVPGGSLFDVTPSGIKSIQRLSGASAAIYGVRGFYGVFLIDTK